MTNEEYYIKELENIKQFFTPIKRKIYHIALLEKQAGIPYHYLWLFIAGVSNTIKYDYIPNLVTTLEEYCSYRRINKDATPETIQKIVCKEYKITPQELCRYTRDHKYLRPRQICMYFTKELTKLSSAEIGEFFGGFDHSTSLHAIKTIQNFIDTECEFAAQIEEIRKLLK